MSLDITFDNPQDVEYSSSQVAENASGVVMTRWFEETEDVLDENDVKVDYKYRIHVHIKGSRTPLKNLLYNHQTELKAIMDSADTAQNKKAAIVKKAVEEYGAGVGYNI